MKPYIHICQNEDCQTDIVVEIIGYDAGEDAVLGRAWEDCSPGSPPEVEYEIPDCHECGMAQEDSREIENDILEWVQDQASDSNWD
jgi:hypothetical protein